MQSYHIAKSAICSDQEVPSSRSVPPSSDVPEGQQEHVRTPVPFRQFWGSPGQHPLKVTVQDTRQMSVLEPGASGRVLEAAYFWGGADQTGSSNHKGRNSWSVADLRGEEPFYCRVGDCRYWHTDSRQVKRHRDTHFERRYGFVCPNQATCPSRGGSFRRRDAVGAHCKRSPLCGDALEASNGMIWFWGTPATEGDLWPYDPKFHIPYKRFDGRTRRGGGKVAKICW